MLPEEFHGGGVRAGERVLVEQRLERKEAESNSTEVLVLTAVQYLQVALDLSIPVFQCSSSFLE